MLRQYREYSTQYTILGILVLDSTDDSKEMSFLSSHLLFLPKPILVANCPVSFPVAATYLTGPIVELVCQRLSWLVRPLLNYSFTSELF